MGYLPDRKRPVVVQSRDALEVMIGLAKATGLIVFDEDVADAEVFEISDGVTATEYTFLDTPAGDPDEVRIETVGTITGTLDPDVTGTDYALMDALHNEARAWYSATTGYYIYWDGTDTWIMFDNFGVDEPTAGAGGDIFWSRTNADPVGAFTASTEASGEATLALAQDAELTRDAALAAINANAQDPDAIIDPQRGVWGTATLSGSDPALALTNTVPGALGNVEVTTDSDLTVSGMAGGSDGGSLAGGLLVGPVNVTVTDASLTLAELLEAESLAIPSSTQRVALIPSDVVTWVDGDDADADSPQVPEAGIVFGATPERLSTITFYASDVPMQVMLFA